MSNNPYYKRKEKGLCVRCGLPKDNETIRCNKCKDEMSKARKKIYDQNKRVIFEYYGGKCTCCGEANPLFLTIDHINNDGSKHRKNKQFRSNPFHWIIKNDFPDDLQLLCFNCNCGRQLNGGICPHNI